MFYDKFIELCKKNRVKPSAVAREIGLTNSSATYWKRGSVPKLATMQRIADYFHVSIDDLLEMEALPEKELVLSLGEGQQKAAMSSGAIELEAFDAFLESIGYKTYIAPSRLDNPEGKEGLVWMIEDLRSKKRYAARTADLDKLKDSVLDYAKFQVYELLQRLQEISSKDSSAP